MSDANDLADALRGALAPRTTLIHPTYRHLSRPLTIAGLNVSQWVIALCGVTATWVLSAALPLPAQWALSLAGSLIGVPSALLFVLAADGDFNARPILRSVINWRASARVLLPTSDGRPPHGYRLTVLAPPAPLPTYSEPAINHMEDLWRP
jgi:hypothetical protein